MVPQTLETKDFDFEIRRLKCPRKSQKSEFQIHEMPEHSKEKFNNDTSQLPSSTNTKVLIQ